MKKESKVKEFWRKNKTKIIIGTGVAIIAIGTVIYVCNKKGKIITPSLKEQINNLKDELHFENLNMIEWTKNAKTDNFVNEINKNILYAKDSVNINKINTELRKELMAILEKNMELGIEYNRLLENAVNTIKEIEA